MIDENGTVKLGDFGIAHASGRLTRTRTGSVKGKSRYMAPEQLDRPARSIIAPICTPSASRCSRRCSATWRASRATRRRYGPMFTWPRRVPPELVPPDVAEILRRARRRRSAGALRRRGAVPPRGGDGARAPRARLRRRELARDLASLDEGFLSELPTITSEAIELHTDQGGETSPQHQPYEPPPFPLMAEPYPSSSQLRIGRRAWSRSTVIWAAGAAGAAALAIAALLVGGASSAARAPTAASLGTATQLPSSLPPRRAATGTLAVEAPAGSTVTIGSTIYPAGALELPPGEYEVTLKRRPRSRGVVRHVTVGEGAVTPIKL